ncbi:MULTISPECIES: carboxymuconolactone decarboxylase family protein [Rhodococcus]|uniref:carboxymuconolactone decarboxylase family protein n=1 Tax=Rhodococcus TaxID=1827 RepID=UPI001E420250|nr:carboxymuconolactone decarboxylase family protein [Rhodococcus pyridinivorans]MCD2118256.1 carboxymuconolactone decarboxylase family protein [Rhodococcus pyridinivorans]MCZ4627127.1 carboxymuconolactone decarboxylase family protein [Rhodococcus pyridinivorans]MCZ4648335.1 carboxymuconolactone decarboxylase family protein [Rhodococcus pyridinivorans]MDJ0481045.1 carboxymuconolactone decarboxylase family protein [Rhodococcus pyridinivorans]MDV7254494.1 carboxymuconolactone decarboxylase famil
MAHINLGKQHPAAYKNVLALNKEVEEAVSQAGLDAKLAELVKIRTSQLNGCAFCLRMHTRDALEKGETTARLAVVAAWWESQYFTDQERAALALAEEVTRPMEPGRHEWDNGALSDEQVSAVTWLAIVMNAWNRIAVRSHYPVAT